MTLVKSTLKTAIKSFMNDLKTFDGTTGKNIDDSIEKFADSVSTAIDDYIKTSTVTITPIQISSAGLSNSGGPVVSSNNLTGGLS